MSSRAQRISPALRCSSFAGSRIHVARVGRVHHKRRTTFCVRAYIGKYLSEALQNIFSVADDQPVQWQKVATPYSGKITVGDHKRLSELYKAVEAVRGCTDPDASNYDSSATMDDGSCIFDSEAEPSSEDMEGYLTKAVKGVFAHQFKGDDTEPNWPMSPYNGAIHSKRDIDRMVSFSKVVKKTLDDVEVEGE